MKLQLNNFRQAKVVNTYWPADSTHHRPIVIFPATKHQYQMASIYPLHASADTDMHKNENKTILEPLKNT